MNIGDVVRLKEGKENFYSFASPGAEGIIKDKKLDDNDFELVYVRWFDKEDDGWTFASHFDLIEKDDSLLPSFDNEETNAVDLYISEMSDAFDDVSESEAFMTLSISRVKHPETGHIYLMPKIHTMASSKEATLAIEAQIIQIASEIYSSAVRNSLEFGGEE